MSERSEGQEKRVWSEGQEKRVWSEGQEGVLCEGQEGVWSEGQEWVRQYATASNSYSTETK